MIAAEKKNVQTEKVDAADLSNKKILIDLAIVKKEVAPKVKSVDAEERIKEESGEDEVIKMFDGKEVKYVQKPIDGPVSNEELISQIVPEIGFQETKRKIILNSFTSVLKLETPNDVPAETIGLITGEDEGGNSKASDNNHNLVEKLNDPPKFGKWNVIGMSNEIFMKYHVNRLKHECLVTIARHIKRGSKNNHIGTIGTIGLITGEDEGGNSKASDNNHNLVEKLNDPPKFGKWNVIGMSNEIFMKYHVNRLKQECLVTIARHVKRGSKNNRIGTIGTIGLITGEDEGGNSKASDNNHNLVEKLNDPPKFGKWNVIGMSNEIFMKCHVNRPKQECLVTIATHVEKGSKNNHIGTIGTIGLITGEDEGGNSKASDNNHNLVEKLNDPPKFGKWNVIGMSNEIFMKYHVNRLKQECLVTIARHVKRGSKNNHIGSPEKKVKISTKREMDFLVATHIQKSKQHPVVVAKNMPLKLFEKLTLNTAKSSITFLK